jgi:hypothetical protein
VRARDIEGIATEALHQIHVSTLLAAHISQIFVLPRLGNKTWASEQIRQ